MIIEESNLRFEFAEDNWWVVKFDEHINYTKVNDSLSGTKAVDFLGIYNNESLVLFEVKNFRNHTADPSTKARLADYAEELTTEIAQKVRDSIACIVASIRTTTNDAERWEQINKIITTNKRISIIAWVEEDIKANTPYYKQKTKAHLSVRINKLKNKLHWLNAKVSMESIKNTGIVFEGLSINYLKTT